MTVKQIDNLLPRKKKRLSTLKADVKKVEGEIKSLTSQRVKAKAAEAKKKTVGKKKSAPKRRR